MKKTVAGLLALTVMVSGAFAAPPNKAPKRTTIHCPVMTKNVVNIAVAKKKKRYADYKGRRYYFCCNICPVEFKKNPAKFAKGESVRTPRK